MNDILKYWPIRFMFEGVEMMIPMGEIISITEDEHKCAKIDVRGDVWRSSTAYKDVMLQWRTAIATSVNHHDFGEVIRERIREAAL